MNPEPTKKLRSHHLCPDCHYCGSFAGPRIGCVALASPRSVVALVAGGRSRCIVGCLAAPDAVIQPQLESVAFARHPNGCYRKMANRK